MSLDFILNDMSPEDREAANLRAASFGRKLEKAPRIIFLVGVPGSGKSTWRAKYLADNPDRDTVTVSSDDLIEAYAAERGLNYSQAHREIDMNQLDKQCSAAVRVAVARGQDVIIDRTNMRFKPRNRFLSQVSKRYTRVAVLFWVECDTVRQRLIDRKRATGKHVPFSVAQEMFSTYQAPTTDEFDLIGVYPTVSR